MYKQLRQIQETVFFLTLSVKTTCMYIPEVLTFFKMVCIFALTQFD